MKGFKVKLYSFFDKNNEICYTIDDNSVKYIFHSFIEKCLRIWHIIIDKNMKNMKNRIQSFLDVSTISEKVPVLERGNLESLFDGPKTFESLLSEALEAEREKGYKEAINKIIKEVQKGLREYISQIITSISLVEINAKKFLPNVEIVDRRAKMCYGPNQINIFFVIKSSIEDEISFSNLLNKVEGFILKRNNYISEIFHINEKDKEIDYTAIKNDYPFTIKTTVIEK